MNDRSTLRTCPPNAGAVNSYRDVALGRSPPVSDHADDDAGVRRGLLRPRDWFVVVSTQDDHLHLLVEAEERFRRLGLTGIETRLGDGAAGWPEAAPFQGILVTAAAPHVPQPLADQVAPGGGGRLVIPIGDLASQELVIWERGSDGTPRERRAGGVRFVPLISRLAFTEEPEWR